MENIKLIFCEENSATQLQVYVNSNNKLYLEVNMNDGSFYPSFIFLDEQTSKRLLSHLEDEIEKFNPNERIKLKFK